MTSPRIILQKMWSRQQISHLDIDYNLWKQKRELIRQMSCMNQNCLFTVDVFKNRYDFAADSFSDIFGYNLSLIKNIEKQGDLLEERIHPEDRDKIIDIQIKHSQFIYSLPVEKRNDYRTVYQFRMLNASNKYINIVSRQEVVQTDKNGKAWIIMGAMDISPDQILSDHVKYSSLNIKTGEIVTNFILSDQETLTGREKEILQLIGWGLLSKEIANKLNISVHTVNNHRKNILLKLGVDNSIEAINYARNAGLLH